MSSFDDLLRRLDSADAAQWEEEYARVAVDLDRDQAFEVVRSERVYAEWFAFRFDAGPPGEPLPRTRAALEAVLTVQGSPLDAYRVVFESPPVAKGAPADLRQALLCNAAACALKRGTSWFATWLAARAGLAAIALGNPERAWRFLDGLTINGRRHPHLDKLANFEPLRRSEIAQRSLWVRAAICRLWPGLGVSVVPSLPSPAFATDELSLEETLDELTRIGATKVRTLVESFAEAVNLAALERHDHEPLVRDLRKRALEGNLEVPTIDHVDAWFLDWAHAVARSGDAQLSRLAGLVLHAAGFDDTELIAMLVLRAARATNLEVLATGLDIPEFRALLDELELARAALPAEVADALVAMALPHHARHGEAPGVLAPHVEQLERLGAPVGGVVDHIATMMRTLGEDRQRDHAQARPQLEHLIAEAGREAGQLETAGRRLSQADVERVAGRLEVPEITIGLLEIATEATAELPPLDALLLVLALRRALGDSDHRVHWEASLARAASDAIYALGEPLLFDLRLRLLDEAIQAAHPHVPVAELYFQRANTRRAVRAGGERRTDLALADMRTAIRRARAEGDVGLCAAATAALVKFLVSNAAGAASSLGDRRAEAESAIADVLGLPLEPYDRARVYQARGHLVRLSSPEDSVKAFQKALALLEPGERFWAEIAAELVTTLSRVERFEEAVQRGTECLNSVGARPGVELGMLHMALGEALLESNCRDDARRQLQNGLQLVRGRDVRNEALARLHLARLELVAGDHLEAEEHLRFLRDHREEVAPLMRRDLDLLDASAAAARGDTAEQRAVLARTLSTVEDERVRLGLRLEIARLDLIEGRPVRDLDALVLVGLTAELDSHHDAVLADVICNHGETLAPSTREGAVAWVGERRRNKVVRFQQKPGQAEVPRAKDRQRESIVAFMTHPAGKAFLGARARLMATSERDWERIAHSDPLGLVPMDVAVTQMERDAPGEHLDRAEDVLASLAAAPADAARPGRFAARVVVLAHLVRSESRTLAEMRAATAEAVDVLGEVEPPVVRSTLLREVAVAWSPPDHVGDPVRDFALAVDLLRRCLELEGGAENAVGDTIAYLARALRYSPVGDLQDNLRQARKLYRLRLARARSADDPDVVANLLHNLAEIEGQMGTGSRLERLRAVENLQQEAAKTAQLPHRKARYNANLAWTQTQIGIRLGKVEGQRQLEKALATFDQVDRALLEDHVQESIDGNRQVCEATLASLIGGPGAEIASWRAYLARLDESVAPYRVETAKHNLANALLFCGEVTREALAEGLQLSREAAEVRTLEADPRHHWETTLNIGRAILGALTSGRVDTLPMTPREAAAEAGTWLRRAATAARALGPGEELLDAAFDLVVLANGAPTPESLIEAAEEAWAHVRQASAYLLLDPRGREREAAFATWTAVQLAGRLAERSLTVHAQGLSFVLHGEKARLVERWIVRAQQPAKQPLQARLSRPKGVSASVWDAWRKAVAARDQRQMADALERIRAVAPEFLAEDHANDATWRWLESRPGSVAVATVVVESMSLVLVMQSDSPDARRTWVLGLELAPPPIDLDTFPGLMRRAIQRSNAHAELEELTQWVRRGVVDPIERFLGGSPKAVLWSPGPGLRLVAPSAIWRSVPVASATSLLLPDLSYMPSRRRSSLVVLADPGAKSPEPQLDLHGQGVPALQVLETAAALRGPVRLLGSVGERFGRALLGDRPAVRDTPASARDVLLEVAEHEVIVLVAHGEVESLSDAAMLCLDAAGTIERLDVTQLQQVPDAFAGATVLLLSCEGGRVGDSLVEPGGLAGTLVAAGAACVVAPLWPVRLDIAEQVARTVLEGMAAADEPWAALAQLSLRAGGDSPKLGRPAPSLSERRAEEELQRLAFVAWVA